MKEEVFNVVLESMENEDIRRYAEKCIATIPPYFYEVGASSTGKYHPAYALGPGGLARHTLAVVRFLNHMFSVESVRGLFKSRERDLLRVAAVMHDSRKSGDQEDYEKSKYTRFDHPLRAAKVVREIEGISRPEREYIAVAVESHMGEWCTDKRNPNIVLPKPENKAQIILHLADYLASRKDIEVAFDGESPAQATPPRKALDPDTWVIPFGKHAGKKLVDVYNSEPRYISWARQNITGDPFASLLRQLDERSGR